MPVGDPALDLWAQAQRARRLGGARREAPPRAVAARAERRPPANAIHFFAGGPPLGRLAQAE